MDFIEFDPLLAKGNFQTEAAIIAVKREIQNILDCYMGWYDPFCELIQNALDAVDEKCQESNEGYLPKVRIIIDLLDNSLTVSDNGTGLSKEKYQQFLAPSFSFKSGNTRGHKGVGTTYIAYGFNYTQICSKTNDFYAIGKMIGARNWLNDPSPSGNPKVSPDTGEPKDDWFESVDSGVSITVKFSKGTKPNDLSWLRAITAKQWKDILSVKTAVGAIKKTLPVTIEIIVVSKDGGITTETLNQAEYLWPHQLVNKHAPIAEVNATRIKLYQEKGASFRMPPKYSNLDCVYQIFDKDQLSEFIDTNDSGDARYILDSYHPYVYFCYMYSANVWSTYHDESLKLRKGVSVLGPGIQLAANNMPQGELIIIPLKKNIGRQNQAHAIIHFDNCRADLGRKGFQKDLVEFSQDVVRKILERKIPSIREYLRKATGAPGNLQREQRVADWKDEFIAYEGKHPLSLENEHFFRPLNKVAITSIPTREQDVIALFNQLLAGGVIRGLRVMSTNERFTYDGMYRVIIDPPVENHIYDSDVNPLGLDSHNILLEQVPFKSNPRILEYKYSIDGLIEDLEGGVKNTNDIDLLVVWETGEKYEGNYYMSSLLDPDNLYLREYHGVSHILSNTMSNQKELDVIVLKELVEFLNDRASAVIYQVEKYSK